MQNHSKMTPEIRSGPKAPGRDGLPGKVALVFVWFSFCGSSFVGGLLLKRSLVAAPRRDFAYIFGLRKRTFFRRFFKLVLGRFFIGFGGLLGAQFGSFFNVFSMKKSTTFWDRFSEAFGRASGTPDPPKLSSRVYETLIFKKLHFSLQAGFWMQNGPQTPPKMDPKSFKKHIKKMMHFLIQTNMAPTGTPKPLQNQRFFGTFSHPRPGTPQKSAASVTWRPNGPKMTPKWTQNEAKMHPNWETKSL